METKRIAGCLVVRKNKILLLKKRAHQWWELPGGKIDPGETAEKAALRELYEETACTGSITGSLGVIEFLHKGYRGEFHLFAVDLHENSQMDLNEPTEFEDVRFIPIEDTESIPLSPLVRQIFATALIQRPIVVNE